MVFHYDVFVLDLMEICGLSWNPWISMENLVFLCWLLPSIWQKCVYFTWFRLDSIGNPRRFSGFHLRISSKFAHAWCLDSDQDVQLNIWWLGCKSKTIGIELNFQGVFLKYPGTNYIIKSFTKHVYSFNFHSFHF